MKADLGAAICTAESLAAARGAQGMTVVEPKDPIRSAFEYWFSDEGEAPRAIERDMNGNYRLMQAVHAWGAWQAAWKAATAAGVKEAGNGLS